MKRITNKQTMFYFQHLSLFVVSMMLCFVSNLSHLSNPSSITADSGISLSLITDSEHSPKSTTFTSSSSSSCKPNKWSKTLTKPNKKRSITNSWPNPGFRVTVSDQIVKICSDDEKLNHICFTFFILDTTISLTDCDLETKFTTNRPCWGRARLTERRNVSSIKSDAGQVNPPLQTRDQTRKKIRKSV